MEIGSETCGCGPECRGRQDPAGCRCGRMRGLRTMEIVYVPPGRTVQFAQRDHLTYLASPYSDPDAGVRESRYRAACAVASVLTTRGELVYSPVAHGHGIALSGSLPVSW